VTLLVWAVVGEKLRMALFAELRAFWWGRVHALWRGVAPRPLPSATLLGPVALRDRTDTPCSIIGKDTHFERRCVHLGDAHHDDGGTVTLTSEGFQNSNDWHLSDHDHSSSAKTVTGRGVLERAVLMNSVAHYAEMRVGRPMPSAPATGENLLVSAEFNIDSLCIGDVITCDEAESIRLVVTHVRRPCARFAAVFSHAAYLRIMQRGLGGIFLAVDSGGVLDTPGALFRVAERPHPAWPLRRVNALVYGASTSASPKWRGTLRELDELLALRELGEFQWKDVLRKAKERCGTD